MSGILSETRKRVTNGRMAFVRSATDFAFEFTRENLLAPPHTPAFPPRVRRHQFPTLQTRYPKNKMRRRGTVPR